MRWPGVICFISEKDCCKILRALRRELNLASEANHKHEMKESLIKANVAAHGEEAEPEIRRIINRGGLDGVDRIKQ